MEDQIVTIWLPIGITLAFGVIGMLRGAAREAVVAVAVVLAAFINRLWAGQWSDGVHEVFPGMDKGQEEFALATAVLWLVVLGLGYGLGSVLPKEKPERASRLGGLLLGLASGAAVAGYMLLYAYEFLDGADRSSRFYESIVSRSFMIWAMWYPLVLAIAGAIVVFVGPMRRAQKAVAQPSAASNWSPTTPPQTPAPPMASTMFTPAMASGATAVASSEAPTSPYAVGPQPYTGPQPYGGPQPTVAMPVVDAPPTTMMPIEPRPTPVSSEDMSATRSFSDVLAPAPTPLQAVGPEPSPWSGGQGTGTDPHGTYSPPSSGESSWLLQPITDDKPDTGEPDAEKSEPGASVDEPQKPMMATTSFGTEHPIPSSPQGAGSVGSSPPAATNERNCPNCGASVMPGASFCTDCGTRIT
jgi:uncharacterized membrane protein required for colicin V production